MTFHGSIIFGIHIITPSTLHMPSTLRSFWCRDCFVNSDIYRSLAKCSVGNGKSLIMWKDVWKDSNMEDKYIHLHSFVKDDDINIDMVVSHVA